MKNVTKLIGIIALVAVIGFFFTACDDDTSPEDPKKCLCAPGTIHLENEPNDCNNMADSDCKNKCETGVAGIRLSNGIPVTNRDTDVGNFSSNVANVESAFEMVEEYYSAQAEIAKNSIGEISIASGPGSASYTLKGSKYVIVIPENAPVNSIATFIRNFANDISMEAQVKNSARDTIRLVAQR